MGESSKIESVHPDYDYLRAKYSQQLQLKKHELLLKNTPIVDELWNFRVAAVDDVRLKTLYKEKPAYTLLLGFKLQTSRGKQG